MGENMLYAYRGRWFSLGGNHSTYCKMYTIFDILIIPDGTHQNITVNYTKYDGTSVTINSGNIPMGGQSFGSSSANGNKYIHEFHMGINFERTLIDEVKPGTQVTLTATTNISSNNYSDWNKIMADPIVLKNTITKRNS